MGVIDTGAVNAVLGLETLLGLDERLRACGMGTVRTVTPRNIGGIAGGVTPLRGVLLPSVLKQVPGVLCAVVILPSVPLLLPNPLLDAVLSARARCREGPENTCPWHGHTGTVCAASPNDINARAPLHQTFQNVSCVI
eukprot:6471032-Amphidinium_carterae.1